MTFKEFWDRYRVIVPELKMSKDPRADASGLLKKFTFVNSDFIQVGKTKVFYKGKKKKEKQKQTNMNKLKNEKHK